MTKITSIDDEREKRERNLSELEKARLFAKRSKFLKGVSDEIEEPDGMAWGQPNEEGEFVSDDDEQNDKE